MFRKIVLTLFVLAAVASLQGCFGEEAIPSDERIDNVVRILMHEPRDYTLLIRDAEKPQQLHERRVSRINGCWIGGVTYVLDVNPDQPLWLVIHYEKVRSGGGCSYRASLIFHLHGEQDINGAGWDHGKHGSGQTNVVQ